jgi:hypothetical protein
MHPPEPRVLLGEVFFDLDGTLAQNEWPLHGIGEPIKKTVELLKYYHDNHFVCSVYTARPAEQRERIWDWLRMHKLDEMIYRVVTDKPMFGLLIDDRSYNPPWLTTHANKIK